LLKKSCPPPQKFGKNKIVLEEFHSTHTMNPSDPATDFITRRDFMKKSALTVGAITILSQGIGLAAGLGLSSWWDMKCIAPDASEGDKNKFITAEMTDPTSFNAVFDLILATDKTADAASADGYHETIPPFTHDFSLNMTSGGQLSHVSGKNTFKAKCEKSSNVILSSFLSSDSNPTSGTSITSNHQVGLYSVDLTIYIARNFGGPDVSTMIFGEVYWKEILKPSHFGSLRIPPTAGSNLEIVNTFQSKSHS
jgi:hypothetical protein